MPAFDIEMYVTVQDRLTRFWSEHSEGAIRTTLESPVDDFTKCRYRAEAYKDRSSATPDATGYAFEFAEPGGRGPNATSHEENCETSAIGRALANMGYATSHADRPSREEMQKVARSNVAREPSNQPRPQPIQSSTGNMASDPQMGAIYGIQKGMNWTDQQTGDLAHSLFGVRDTGRKGSPNITKAQASQLIEAMNAAKAAGGQ